MDPDMQWRREACILLPPLEKVEGDFQRYLPPRPKKKGRSGEGRGKQCNNNPLYSSIYEDSKGVGLIFTN